MEVLIVGAGCTGLILAHGLKKARELALTHSPSANASQQNGIAVTVFEAESSSTFRPREWSMGIHWSLPMLDHLLPAPLHSRLSVAQNDPRDPGKDADEFRIFDGVSGKVMKAMPLPRTIRVSRRKMRELLCEGLEENIKYGKTLTSIDYPSSSGVTIHFQDGTSQSGSLLIGADGPRSSVREILLGQEKAAPTPLSLVNSQVVVCYGDAEKAKYVRSPHPVFFCTVHPDLLFFQTMQDVPSPDDPANWKFQLFTGWHGTADHSLDQAQRLALLKQRATKLAEPMRSACMWIPDGTQVHYDTYNYWVTTPWDNHGGLVTLAGDAAHPMPPHRGQGLNHAIADCMAIVEAAKKIQDGTDTQKEAITMYDADVVKRGGDEVTQAVQNSKFITDYKMVQQSTVMHKGLDRVN